MTPEKPVEHDDSAALQSRRPYEAPTLTRLGSLTDLTHGGQVSGQTDGFGYSGASGVIPPPSH